MNFKSRPIQTLYMYLQFSIVKDQELNLESYICYVYKIKTHIYLHHQIYNFNNVYKPK